MNTSGMLGLRIAGEAIYTEALLTQQNLLAAQLNQVNDKLEQLTFSVSLHKAACLPAVGELKGIIQCPDRKHLF